MNVDLSAHSHALAARASAGASGSASSSASGGQSAREKFLAFLEEQDATRGMTSPDGTWAAASLSGTDLAALLSPSFGSASIGHADTAAFSRLEARAGRAADTSANLARSAALSGDASADRGATKTARDENTLREESRPSEQRATDDARSGREQRADNKQADTSWSAKSTNAGSTNQQAAASNASGENITTANLADMSSQLNDIQRARSDAQLTAQNAGAWAGNNLAMAAHGASRAAAGAPLIAQKSAAGAAQLALDRLQLPSNRLPAAGEIGQQMPKGLRFSANLPGGSAGDSRPAWLNDFIGQIAFSRLRSAASQQFMVKLQPDNLGEVDVRIEAAKSGRVEIQLQAASEEALEVLARDHRELLRDLRKEGANVQAEDISFVLNADLGAGHHGADDANNFWKQQQSPLEHNFGAMPEHAANGNSGTNLLSVWGASGQSRASPDWFGNSIDLTL